MKPRTILLGIGLFIVVIFCAAMKGYYEDAEEAEHQKNLDSMKKVENIRTYKIEESDTFIPDEF
jgi:hypothetical protein